MITFFNLYTIILSMEKMEQSLSPRGAGGLGPKSLAVPQGSPLGGLAPKGFIYC